MHVLVVILGVDVLSIILGIFDRFLHSDGGIRDENDAGVSLAETR